MLVIVSSNMQCARCQNMIDFAPQEPPRTVGAHPVIIHCPGCRAFARIVVNVIECEQLPPEDDHARPR
jgi:hypothetical protein